MIIETQSLYDYLGRPAGRDLGTKVHTAAVAKGVYVGKKDIETSLVPAGYVCMYPTSFLDEYFNKKPAAQVALEDKIKLLEDRIKLLEDKVDILAPHFKSNKEADDLPF
jgi:hypothetical protein|tara:strand:+ start:101 stop:427 length:327 start_codon:yes stop_codon:yes gene_type:complete